jgi:hypothetical protein
MFLFARSASMLSAAMSVAQKGNAMKRAIALVLVATFPAPAAAQMIGSPFAPARLDHAIANAPIAAQQATCDTSRATGRNDAGERHGRAGWFFGGLGSGLAATFIGAGAITAGAAFTDPQPKEIPPNVEEPCYRDGYRSAAKGKNVTSALFGGLIGSVVWILAYSAAVSD